MSEDCLTLTLFAPHRTTAKSRLPVMVWIYGGGLTVGANSEFDLSDLAERQHVIVVAPNYRLGVFGFMAHPALRGVGEGAYATLDQQAALQWVQRNIANFGGDAGRVTIFGESAGAQSACMQLTLRGAVKLIHGAILQSDTCIMPDTWTPQPEAEHGGVEMAHDLGCIEEAIAAECLRHVPADALLAATSHRRGDAGNNSWAPMSGGDVLPMTPRQVFESGEAAAVPVLLGSNHDEGNVFADRMVAAGMVTTRAGYANRLRSAIFGDSAPVAMLYADLAEQSYATAYAAWLTDSHFACPVLSFQRLMSKRAPVYAYEFDDPNAPPPLGLKPLKPLGTYHGADVGYIFRRPLAFSNQLDAGQQALAIRMQDAWGSFARSGKPGGSAGAPWPIFDGHRPYLLAPNHKGLVLDFETRHRCAFWNARGY